MNYLNEEYKNLSNLDKKNILPGIIMFLQEEKQKVDDKINGKKNGELFLGNLEIEEIETEEWKEELERCHQLLVKLKEKLDNNEIAQKEYERIKAEITQEMENLNFLNENNFIMFNNGYINLEKNIETNCYIKYFWKEEVEKGKVRKKCKLKPDSKGVYACYKNKNKIIKPFSDQDDLNQFIEILCRYLNFENGNELNFFMRKDIAELCSYNLFLNELQKKNK